MHEVPHHGLTRRQLEYQLSWLMRRRPQDPTKLPEFIGDLVVTLIDRNNVALAAHAAEAARTDLPDGS
ncbi:hypothetical protein SAMN05444365_10618 [Micromonospora pattaloongensis]|uniref:Uncharacterized protein n=1 Tax=Micromonospora pattaloongensis TaxID=405436 RepID=A0A1H3QN58_9ACTN|nr:hypothetical protein [Micromonospora pattaloongensis]SDZ14713.1 hypothetical protein SAMN05444365_10618 [Micromonospora pattaloongensis]